MPDRSSEIDLAVLTVRSDTQHKIEIVELEGMHVSLCTRCGRRTADLVVDNVVPPNCRGFVG